MRACNEFLRDKGRIIEKVFQVPSKSEPEKRHIVQFFSDWHLECNCVAGSFKRPCRHKRIVAEKLAKKGIIVRGQVSLYQAIDKERQ